MQQTESTSEDRLSLGARRHLERKTPCRMERGTRQFLFENSGFLGSSSPNLGLISLNEDR